MGELTLEEQQLSDAACEFVRQNKRSLVEKFAAHALVGLIKPVTFFMAGSPGAGKTEFANRLAQSFQKLGRENLVHIDADAIRNDLPGYNGANSFIFQRAAVKGVNELFNHVIHVQQSCVLDGTFARYDFAEQNIQRCIDHGRDVVVAYLYQDPVDAWIFTQAREKVEGRHIDKDKFIEQFFAAYDSVKKVREKFGNHIELWRVIRDLPTNTYAITVEPALVDTDGPLQYSKSDLERLLNI